MLISSLATLTVLLEQVPALVRPFHPQLTRTFVKSASDPVALSVRNRAAVGLGELMKHQVGHYTTGPALYLHVAPCRSSHYRTGRPCPNIREGCSTFGSYGSCGSLRICRQEHWCTSKGIYRGTSRRGICGGQKWCV